MKKNLLFKLLIVAIILTLSVTVMISCTPEDVPPDTDVTLDTATYAIPENLTISIEIYEGNTDAANLKGTISKETLLSITQQIVSMTTVNDFGTRGIQKICCI